MKLIFAFSLIINEAVLVS